VAGYTESFGTGNYDIWVVKLDSVGAITWEMTYGGAGHDWPRSIKQTSDGGYVVAGRTESFGVGHYDFWILKLDASGEIPGCSAMNTSNATISDTSVTAQSTGVIAQESFSDHFNTAAFSQTTVANQEVVCLSLSPEVSITEVFTCGADGIRKTQFYPGEPIKFHIIYSIVGNPITLYKVKGMIKAFGRPYYKIQSRYPGAGYYMRINRDEDGRKIEVPRHIPIGTSKTIKYKLKLKDGSNFLDQDVATSQIEIVAGP